MKATVYTLIVIAAAAGIAYMVYTGRRKAAFTPTGNFAADDERLYQLIRADLQAFERQTNPNDTLAWFDDIVATNYEGSYIGPNKSKTAAYVRTLAAINPRHAQNRYYGQLLKNLESRYT